MAGWIFRIREANPEHLEIAADRGYWDYEPDLEVRPGDDIFFWQGGKRPHLRAMARALAFPRRLVAGDEHPWNDAVEYVWRVPLELLHAAPSKAVNWALLKRTVIERGLFTRDPVYELSEADSARIGQFFGSSEDGQQQELPLGEEDSGGGDTGGGAGYLAEAERRSLIEMFAQQKVAEHYERQGWQIEDTHIGHPYDLVATKGPLMLYIEAKGTQQDGLEVEVTDGEVQFARRNPGMCQMGIVSGIRIIDEGRVDPGSGSLMILDWDPDAGTLRPTRYRYSPGPV